MTEQINVKHVIRLKVHFTHRGWLTGLIIHIFSFMRILAVLPVLSAMTEHTALNDYNFIT